MEAEFFNGLSDSEVERLSLLAEECAETIQAVTKIMRHGYESVNPCVSDSPNNRANLEEEIGNIVYAVSLMIVCQDLNKEKIAEGAQKKAENVGPYLHHQDKTIVEELKTWGIK